MKGWKKEFDKKFTEDIENVLGSALRSEDLNEREMGLSTNIKHFIENLLEQQKKKYEEALKDERALLEATMDMLEQQKKERDILYEQILAEVIDTLYLRYKKDFCDWENKTHKLGFFKEKIKAEVHNIIINSYNE